MIGDKTASATGYALLSEYSLAISATASPILFLTLLVDSVPRASRSFWRMAFCCSVESDKKSSTVSPFGNFRDLEAIRRKIMAAKERV
jgi:hypothetical protein